MTKSVYVASPEGRVGKSAIALGLIEALARQVKSVAVFRPLVRSTAHDEVAATLVSMASVDQDFSEAVGVSYREYDVDPDAAMAKILDKVGYLQEISDALVIVGSDYNDVFTASEATVNAKIAANLNAPVIMVVRGDEREPADVRRFARQAISEFKAVNNKVISLIATRVDESRVDETREALAELPDILTSVTPEEPILIAPTVRMQFQALEAELWQGTDRFMDRESLGLLVGGMTLPNLLTHLKHEVTLIVPSDRLDLLPGLVLAHRSGTFPTLAAVVLSGGYEIPKTVEDLFNGLSIELPIALAQGDTFTTAQVLNELEGTMTSSPRKIELARALFSKYVDEAALLKAIDVTGHQHPHSADVRVPVDAGRPN